MDFITFHLPKFRWRMRHSDKMKLGCQGTLDYFLVLAQNCQQLRDGPTLQYCGKKFKYNFHNFQTSTYMPYILTFDLQNLQKIIWDCIDVNLSLSNGFSFLKSGYKDVHVAVIVEIFNK